MNQLFRFPSAVQRDTAVDAWLNAHCDALGLLARSWFEVIRDRGNDVNDLRRRVDPVDPERVPGYETAPGVG